LHYTQVRHGEVHPGASRDASNHATLSSVIAGLDPAIHHLTKFRPKVMDARIKSGHDGCEC
jgi:hypothetical protein